jgi:hypothetical protein
MLGTESSQTRRWRRQSRANPSLETPISLLAGKIQGISSDSGVQWHLMSQKNQWNQEFTGQFPTQFNREFFAALQGIESGQQGNFSTHQGFLLRFEMLF